MVFASLGQQKNTPTGGNPVQGREEPRLLSYFSRSLSSLMQHYLVFLAVKCEQPGTHSTAKNPSRCLVKRACWSHCLGCNEIYPLNFGR